MLGLLISSRVRAKILTALFLSPGAERNAWELARSLGESYGAVWKELKRLESLGVMVSEQRGNARVFRVDLACPIEPELRTMILKTEGIGGLLREKLAPMEKVKQAFIYGSIASGQADLRSDVDVMIIGTIDLEEISALVAQAEKELNRPVNYTVFSEEEWAVKLASSDPFAVNVQTGAKIMLKGG